MSVAQPTRMRTDVPANPRNAVRCETCSTTAGPAAKIARKAEPRTEIRLKTYNQTQAYRHIHVKLKPAKYNFDSELQAC